MKAISLEGRAVYLSLRRAGAPHTAAQLTDLWAPTFTPTQMAWLLEDLKRSGYVHIQPTHRGDAYAIAPNSPPL